MYELELNAYDAVVINTSGGKDSQTAMRRVVQLADEQHYARGRLYAVHADLGRMEWAGVKELAQQQAEHYNLPWWVERYRNRLGEEKTLLDYVHARGKWPSSTTRYCTSDFKRGPCSRVFTRLAAARGEPGRPARLLNIFGFRADESPARAKRPVFVRNTRLTNKRRVVDDWLPIHDWTEEQVWADIRASGVPYHPAYDLGMPRLSCCFCIFAPRAALLIAGKANPELLAEYVAVEKAIGHTFKKDLAIVEIADAIAAGEEPGGMDGNWNM